MSYGIATEVPVDDYDLIISIGVAAGRDYAALEKVGINWAQATIPDVDGYLATGHLLDPDGPDGVFSGLDVAQVADKAGCRVSYSAGTYVCNSLAYSLYRRHPRSVFCHIPPSFDDVGLVSRIVEACTQSA